ncbi:hypothetical protein KFE98_16710 [bacterium SCSIO 12741]|nr:hypothetical protein KFE98_16710 [bacterium SCSIO 12741]
MKNKLFLFTLAALFFSCSQSPETMQAPVAEASEEEYAASEANEQLSSENANLNPDWFKPLGKQKLQEFFELALIASDSAADPEMIEASKEAMKSLINLEDKTWIDAFLYAPMFYSRESGQIEELTWTDLSDDSAQMGMGSAVWVTESAEIPFTFFYSAEVNKKGDQTEYLFYLGKVEWKRSV